MTRRDDVAANVDRVRARIAAACAAAGRAPEQVTLVAVTKTFPVDDLRLLAALGVRDIGENRDQEFRPKVESCADLDVTWHFVGQLQRNKAASVAGYADVVHSVDRVPLVRALSRAAVGHGRELRCLVEVALDHEEGRGGAAPDEAIAVADAVAAADGLVIAGVMAVAPLGVDPDEAFARLAEVSARLRAGHPDARWISAGMSGDLEAAIRNGATHVRVGTALLGSRPPVLR
jgi:pyridoxal phosphate enzyme (YggS family)